MDKLSNRIENKSLNIMKQNGGELRVYITISAQILKYFTFDQMLTTLLPPGIFFILPCIETYQKVDLRTITLGVPPQEVRMTMMMLMMI